MRVWGTHQLLLIRVSNIGDNVTLSLRRLGGLLLAKLPITVLLKGTIIPLVRRLGIGVSIRHFNGVKVIVKIFNKILDSIDKRPTES